MGTRVYVGRLPGSARERDVERFFKGYGRVREILLKNGYGFVEFDDHRDAEDAVYELNGKNLMGERVVIEYAKAMKMGRGGGRMGGGGRYDRQPQRRSGGGGGGGGGGGRRDRFGPPLRTKYRVIIENLSSGVSWQDLKDYMRKAGEVTYADAHKQRRNEGIVEFASSADMRNAISKLDDTDLNGRAIRVIEDKPRGSRHSQSRSRSRSRSRSSYRSRSRSISKSRSRSRSKSKSERSSSRSQSRD